MGKKSPAAALILAWLKETPEASKSKLAIELGCHPSRITQILAGDTLSAQLAFKVEQVTGIDARALLGIPKQDAAE